MTTVVIGAAAKRAAAVRLRTLYFSAVGACCVGWWDTEPPKLLGETRKCPRFRPPDIFHDHTVGSPDAVLADLCAAKVLPDRDSFRVVIVPQEWIQAGLRRVQEARVRKRLPPSDPEHNGLFAPEFVKPTPEAR